MDGASSEHASLGFVHSCGSVWNKLPRLSRVCASVQVRACARVRSCVRVRRNNPVTVRECARARVRGQPCVLARRSELVNASVERSLYGTKIP